VYSQVPPFTASDRAMLDVLTCTLDGRLAVLELKADEDIHLPLQGLDYRARVHWHQQRGEFARQGYFAGRELSSAAPLLFLVAPALRVHPANRLDLGAGGRTLAGRRAGGQQETSENSFNHRFAKINAPTQTSCLTRHSSPLLLRR
jgi:hypothetical protein